MTICKYFVVGVISLFMVACSDNGENEPPETESMGETIIEIVQPIPEQQNAANVAIPPADVPLPNGMPQHGFDDLVLTVADRDQQVRLELTPKHLKMKLSAATMAQVRGRDLNDNSQTAISASISRAEIAGLEEVADNQKGGLSTREIGYPIATVESIRYEGEQLWIDLVDGEPLSFDEIKTADGRPVLSNFDAPDAQSIVAAFAVLQAL